MFVLFKLNILSVSVSILSNEKNLNVNKFCSSIDFIPSDEDLEKNSSLKFLS